MNLENICISLENAKKLNEIGIEQQSYFYWEKCPNENNFTIKDEENHDANTYEYSDLHRLKNQEHYSAFTADELVKFIEGLNCDIYINNDPFELLLYMHFGLDNSYGFYCDSLANLLAEALIAYDKEKRLDK